MMRLFSLFFIFLTFISCHNSLENKLIATVYDNELYIDDIIDELPPNVVDTMFFIKKYTNDWVREQLLLHHARLNLDNNLQDFDKEIYEYRNSLLIYTYKKQLINQNLDSMISIDMIKDYYYKYKNEFILNKPIFKGRFLIIDKLAPKLSSIDKWYYSDNKQIFQELSNYCRQFSKEYYMLDTTWQYFSFVIQKLPNPITNISHFLRNNTRIYFEDDDFRYYLYIKDFKVAGDISPLSIQKERIRNVLFNKKKIMYLNKLEDELYNNSLALDKIKFFY